MNQPNKKHAFQVYDVSLEMVALLGPLVRRVQGKDSSLATQMRRAASSVPLNIAEGNQRRGRDRAHFFRIAAGSADELRASIHVATAWNFVEPSMTEDTLAFIDRILAMLWRLTH